MTASPHHAGPPPTPEEHATSAPPRTTRKVLAAQNISRMCLVCGAENVAGLHARFYELEGGELLGVFAPRAEHQSYPGRLHGGISSAILDETIGRAIIVGNAGVWGVTVEFTVRFRRPVPLDGEVRAVGRVTRDTSRLFEGTGELLLADGSVAAEGRGKYLKMGLGEIAPEMAHEEEWFADPRPRPEAAVI
ncbi:MAG: PaaI family thioesterase [Thermoleophilia bacterium]